MKQFQSGLLVLLKLPYIKNVNDDLVCILYIFGNVLQSLELPDIFEIFVKSYIIRILFVLLVITRP